nr:alpha/beta hydrolases superfamily protein [Tanacetum cinerariifolium]
AYEPHALKTLKKQEQSSISVDPLAYLAHSSKYQTSTTVASPTSTSSSTLATKQQAQSGSDAMMATMQQLVNLLTAFMANLSSTEEANVTSLSKINEVHSYASDSYNSDTDDNTMTYQHYLLLTKAVVPLTEKPCETHYVSPGEMYLCKAKGERKSLALKAKIESSDEECLNFESEDEEYAMAVRDFRKFFKRRGDRKCFRCGDPNHLIGECPKPLKYKNHRAFVEGSWSDNGEADDEKVKDETCLIAQASSEFLLLFFNSSANFWQWHLLSSGSGKQSSLAVGTYTASGNFNLAVGMPCVFYSQQSSPKLDAPSAFKFSRIK